MSHISSSFDALYGEDHPDTIYFRNHGKVLVVQETNVDQMETDGKAGGYRNCPGEFAGLHSQHRPYFKRIHVLVDSNEGVYIADRLRDNYHYQVMRTELRSFLLDVTGLKIPLSVVGKTCGSEDDSGVFWVNPPKPGEPDCVIYTSLAPYTVSLTNPTPTSENEQSNTVSNNDAIPSFICVLGAGVDELRAYIDPLRTADIASYLSQSKTPDDNHSLQRNHSHAFNHGFTGLNCTDNERPDLHFRNSPQLTKPMFREPGFEGDLTMADSIANIMAAMTHLMDAVCRVVNVKYYFMDKDRNVKFANKIHEDCRAEMITASTTDLLYCHLDTMNCTRYSQNASHFWHERNADVVSPTSREYRRRHVVNMYGKNHCGSLSEKATYDNMAADDLGNLFAQMPPHCVGYEPSIVLTQQHGDEPSPHDPKVIGHVVGRQIHVDKRVTYSFYVYYLYDWINRRKAAKVPVSWPELVEAVTIAVKYTPSPPTWAYVFKIVTADEGVSVKVPNGIKLSTKLRNIVAKDKSLPMSNTWESPLPLFALYIFKSIELFGGLNRGSMRRMQPSFNKKEVDMFEESESIRRNIQLLTQVRDESIKKRQQFFSDPSNNFEGEDRFFRYARSMKGVTKAYIKQCAANKNSGGVDGMGRLLAHHSIGIVSAGGWAPPENVYNADFSPGTGTAEYMIDRYGINVSKDHGFLDAISNSPVLRPFGDARVIVAENSFCKDGQQWRNPQGRINFVEPVRLDDDTFLLTHENGAPVKRYQDGRRQNVTAGIVRNPSELTNQDGDVRVTVFPSDNHSCRWWDEGVTNLHAVFEESTMICVLKQKELRRFQGREKGMCPHVRAGKRKRPESASTHVAKLFAERSRKWAHNHKEKRRVNNMLKESSWQLFNHVLQHHSYVVLGIGSYPTELLLETAFKSFSKDICAKLQQVKEDVESMITAFPEAEKVHTLRDTSNKWFKKLLRSPQQARSDSDEYYDSAEFYNSHFVMAGSRIIPTFSTFSNHLIDNTRVIDLHVQLSSALSVSQILLLEMLF